MTRARPMPTYLLMCEDDGRRNALREKLRKHANVRPCADAAAARAEVDGTKRAFAGFVIDVEEVGRSVQRLVRDLHRAVPEAPGLVIVRGAAEDQDLDGTPFRAVSRDESVAALRTFVGRGLAVAVADDPHVAAVIEALGRSRGLTPKQMELVALATLPLERKALVEDLGVSPNTLKTRVRQLLRIFGEDTMDTLGKAVLRAALERASGRDASALPAAPTAKNAPTRARPATRRRAD